ncbi:MAG TPA: hypothetical protein VJQ79_03245 [Acidimicrobiia bacterium]|nr:hypothetical protein [Acidimicrobiia bacterium]
MNNRFLLILLSVAMLAACANLTQAPTAEEVASGFQEAYGAFDEERAITYLAEDADIRGLIGSVNPGQMEGTLDEFRLLVAWLKAMGYKQVLHPCEELVSSSPDTKLRCTFDFHGIRSDEVGLGPYTGSYFTFTIQDGKIIEASKHFGTEEFSGQMWEPFSSWVFETYPEDASAMYRSSGAGARLTEESVRLWELHSQEYVELETPDS